MHVRRNLAGEALDQIQRVTKDLQHIHALRPHPRLDRHTPTLAEHAFLQLPQRGAELLRHDQVHIPRRSDVHVANARRIHPAPRQQMDRPDGRDRLHAADRLARMVSHCLGMAAEPFAVLQGADLPIH